MKVENELDGPEYVKTRGFRRMLDNPSESWLKLRLKEEDAPRPRVVGGLRLWRVEDVRRWVESKGI